MRAGAQPRPSVRRGRQRPAAGAGWVDLCQIGDAAFDPFVEAVASRSNQSVARVQASTRLRSGVRLAALAEDQGALAMDSGLRVLGRPVWRLGFTGAYVFEAMPGESVLLMYAP